MMITKVYNAKITKFLSAGLFIVAMIGQMAYACSPVKVESSFSHNMSMNKSLNSDSSGVQPENHTDNNSHASCHTEKAPSSVVSLKDCDCGAACLMAHCGLSGILEFSTYNYAFSGLNLDIPKLDSKRIVGFHTSLYRPPII